MWLTQLQSNVAIRNLRMNLMAILLRIMSNAEASELWGLRDEEVLDQSLMNLDIGLSVEQLRTPVRAILTGRTTFQEVVLDATNRRGKAFQCRITCSPLVGAEQDTQGVILLMEEWNGQA